MILSFGKYSGRTVEEVQQEDPQYLEWLVESGVAKGYLAREIERVSSGEPLIDTLDKVPVQHEGGTFDLTGDEVTWLLKAIRSYGRPGDRMMNAINRKLRRKG